ncbi:hypothetical protein K1T71_001943 [Dendrolimus kikuchii]|uniref:Uncharacterized protein n=1 Tax=Dendrolimus kikuchii TaxID=765133 RepID=A0ACC1DFN8_9NEOP|nr:hypothetical protein K1T71_001943 [Dendrolimus kikuchii]
MVYIKLFFLIYITIGTKSEKTSFQSKFIIYYCSLNIIIVSFLIRFLLYRHQSRFNIIKAKYCFEYYKVKSKLNITVYYEILCPASVRFFTQQLRPAVELLAPYLDIHLIPYGHARTFQVRGHYEFRCQHGPAECYGNKLQACVVDALRNNTQAVLFNSCLLQYSAYRSNYGFDYSYIMRWCSYKLHTPVQGIITCMHNGRASLLLKKYGDITHALSPQYVPFVLVDGSTDKQNDASHDMISTVCKLLNPTPLVCYR